MHDKNSTPAAVRLNPHQQAAVDCDDDRILVKAGAGSGKTQVSGSSGLAGTRGRCAASPSRGRPPLR